MKYEFRLADIGEGLEEAEIISWLVNVGDRVSRDQPLIEVMTDKSNAELPAPVAGTIVGLSGEIGDIIEVGGLIAIIEDQETEPAGEAGPAPATPSPAPPAAQPHPSVQPATATDPAPAPQTITARPKASPSTRRVAAERGIDLATIAGSGPGGRILLADLDEPGGEVVPGVAPFASEPVQQAVPPRAVVEDLDGPHSEAVPGTTSLASEPVQQAVTPATSTTAPSLELPAEPTPAQTEPVPKGEHAPPAGVVPLRGVRRKVAQNMAKAWADIPHIHAFAHIDAEPLLEMRARLRETERSAYSSLTPLSFFVAAVARALATHAGANASIDMQTETITHHPSVNVGIAVAAPQGLVVPVLRGADQLDFETLSLTLNSLIRGAREGSLRREHFQGGTVTITNFGSLGGEQAVPIIRPPESMIFGFGSIAARPFVFEDEVVARQTMHLVAGADHRLLDGDITTAVLNDVGESLTDPLRLVL